MHLELGTLKKLGGLVSLGFARRRLARPECTDDLPSGPAQGRWTTADNVVSSMGRHRAPAKDAAPTSRPREERVGKLVMIGAAGVAYMVGARVGRDRYEQITTQADRLWRHPLVQRALSQVQQRVTSGPTTPTTDLEATDTTAAHDTRSGSRHRSTRGDYTTVAGTRAPVSTISIQEDERHGAS